MGRDKALLPYGGYLTLAEYQYQRLMPLFGRVSLSAKSNKFMFDAPVILDHEKESSPIVALQAVLSHAQMDAVFVLSVDMPKVDKRLIERLYDVFERDTTQIAVARSTRGTEPLCAIYHRDLIDMIDTMIRSSNHRMHDVLRHARTVEVLCERDEIFVNLNTPEDYRLSL
jgi:molybdopterin-guanine dinucleotide biosynthesis protein A